MDFWNKVMNHRTIRDFKDEAVEKKIFDNIIDATLRTATSNGMQQASIISVTDKGKREKISKICGQQYVATAPHLLIFVADNYRNREIYAQKGETQEIVSDVDVFFQGFTDAALMAQNANNLIEYYDLGAVFLGSILKDVPQMIKILNLPKLTFPVVGLAFGYPNQSPNLKPRIPKEYRFFENEYKIESDYVKSLAEYDKEMSNYCDLRDTSKNLEPFTDQVVKRLSVFSENNESLLDIARDNGYKI